MTRTFQAGVEQCNQAPDKYELNIKLDQDHNTEMEFTIEMTEPQAKRLLIDLVHEVGVPEVVE